MSGFNWNEICQYPPKEDATGFDTEALKEIASGKLNELHIALSEVKKLELRRNRLIDKYDKSYKRKLTLQVWSYEIENKKYYLDIWIKYWLKIAGFENKHKNPKLALDVEKARNVQIENLYESELRKIGNRLTGICPFHNPRGDREKSSSFYIFEDNSFHCFSCLAHGSGAIDFLMQLKKLDFVSALKELNYGY